MPPAFASLDKTSKYHYTGIIPALCRYLSVGERTGNGLMPV